MMNLFSINLLNDSKQVQLVEDDQAVHAYQHDNQHEAWEVSKDSRWCSKCSLWFDQNVRTVRSIMFAEIMFALFACFFSRPYLIYIYHSALVRLSNPTSDPSNSV